MIIIVNGQVFIDGKETQDPTLIGYAVLDFAESQNNTAIKKLEFVGEELEIINYKNFLEENSLLDTYERKILFKIIMNMPDNFSPSDFIKKGTDCNITNDTCYNFLKTMIKYEVIKINPKNYSFKRKCIIFN